MAILIALGVTLPIALRRSRPLLAAFLGTLPWLIPTDGYVVVGYVAIFVLIYSVAAYVASALRVGLIAAYIIALGLVGAWRDDEKTGEYVGAVTAVVLPVLAGRLVRHHRAQTHQLRELTKELEHERERTAQMAVAEERARIARELHDVVAHGLSVIAIQADGAEAALEKDPELARRPLQAIRGSAEEALGEMRRLLGVLRAGRRRPGARAATRAGAAPEPGRARPRGRDAGHAARRGHAAAAARESRSVGVPDRPGGAHERAQARGRTRRPACASCGGATCSACRCATPAPGGR